MNTKWNKLGSWIAALAVGSAIIGTSTAVHAAGPQRWDICPAIDTVALCEIPRQPTSSGSAGTDVALVPVDLDRTAYSTGHANEAKRVGIDCLGVPRSQLVACPD